ncbi:unnamed protein product, partial [Ixodes pacificus]
MCLSRLQRRAVRAFYNRKKFHFVVLQGCCDSSMVFTRMHVGSPGRMNDARILTNSGLDDILSAPPEDSHILDDSACPLKVNLMRSYKDNGHLTRRKSHFNTSLGASRSMVERAFAQLKGKFRRLKHIDMDNLNMVLMFVMATCVVHNFILTSAQPF